MEDDDYLSDNPDNNTENPPVDTNDLSPDQELDQDINNLSLEDSPAGPGIRIASPEVSTIPDSLSPDIGEYDSDVDTNFHTTCTSTQNSSQNVIIDSSQPPEQLSSSQNRDVFKHRPPLRKPFAHENTNQPVANKTDKETPFSSATDLVVDKSTGAISKSSVPANNSTPIQPEIQRGCVPITNFFKQTPRKGPFQKSKPPNICTWREKPTTSSTEKVTLNTSYETPNTFEEPLPQRNPNKRSRRNTGSSEDTTRLDNRIVSDNTHQPIINTNAPQSNGASCVPNQVQNDNNTDRNVTFSLQGEETTGDFLPIPPEGLPFFRRARGCYSAKARANTRALHLDRLSDNGKPPRWAYGIGPMPSYMKPVAQELVNMKRRHALEFTRAVARSLRESSEASQRQGNLNLDTVQNIYGRDSKGFDKAATKLTTLVNRDNTQESERLSRREELICRSPTTDDDIRDHLSGRKTATRSYAGVVANDPPPTQR